MLGTGQTLAPSFFGDQVRSIGSPTSATLRPCALRRHRAQQKSQGKGEGKLKNGGKYLVSGIRRGCAFAVRSCPEARRFLERQKARTSKHCRHQGAGFELARACCHLLKEGEPFGAAQVAVT